MDLVAFEYDRSFILRLSAAAKSITWNMWGKL